MFFVPDAKMIAVLPPGNDRVVRHKFDADPALAKSGLDYLIVTSRPPAAVAAGAMFTYPVAAKSNKGAVTVRLDSGPAGMAVSAAGVVSWAVPADAPAGDWDVILTVRDAGYRETFCFVGRPLMHGLARQLLLVAGRNTHCGEPGG